VCKDLSHREIAGKNLRDELGEPIGSCMVDQKCQEDAPEPLSLKGIRDNEGDLSHLLIIDPFIATNTNDIVTVESDEGNPASMINRRKGARLSFGQVWVSAEETAMNTQSREVLVKFRKRFDVVHLNLTNDDPSTVREHINL
jgi:hypothetical protein